MPVPFISEQKIDAVAEALQPEELDNAIREMESKQPALFAYILSDTFKLLHPGERDFLMYLALICWKAVQSAVKEEALIEEEAIGAAEEKNWGIFEASTGKAYKERLDPFFSNIDQEDLLAFIEDTFEPDNESKEDGPEITKEGREVLLVGLITIIDVLT